MTLADVEDELFSLVQSDICIALFIGNSSNLACCMDQAAQEYATGDDATRDRIMGLPIMAGMMAVFDPEVEFAPMVAGVTGSSYRGEQGVRDWLAAMDQEFELFRNECRQVEDHGVYVLAVIGARTSHRTTLRVLRSHADAQR